MSDSHRLPSRNRLRFFVCNFVCPFGKLCIFAAVDLNRTRMDRFVSRSALKESGAGRDLPGVTATC